MNIVEKYYGKEIFYEDAFNQVVPAELEEALKENNIEAVSRPEIDVTQIEKRKRFNIYCSFPNKTRSRT